MIFIDTVFPIIDLIRVISLKKNVQKFVSENCLEIIDVLVSKIDVSNLTNTMLILRVLCNLFTSYDNKIEEITRFLIDNRVNILTKLTKCFTNENLNKNFQNGFATLLINYSVLFNKLAADRKLSNDVVEAMKTELLHYLSGELMGSSFLCWDSEAVFRLLVCIGTIICDNAYMTTIGKSIVDLKQFCLKLELQQEKNLPKVNSCVKFLKSLLR